jgi:hypothetical protein
MWCWCCCCYCCCCGGQGPARTGFRIRRFSSEDINTHTSPTGHLFNQAPPPSPIPHLGLSHNSAHTRSSMSLECPALPPSLPPSLGLLAHLHHIVSPRFLDHDATGLVFPHFGRQHRGHMGLVMRQNTKQQVRSRQLWWRRGWRGPWLWLSALSPIVSLRRTTSNRSLRDQEGFAEGVPSQATDQPPLPRHSLNAGGREADHVHAPVGVVVGRWREGSACAISCTHTQRKHCCCNNPSVIEGNLVGCELGGGWGVGLSRDDDVGGRSIIPRQSMQEITLYKSVARGQRKGHVEWGMAGWMRRAHRTDHSCTIRTRAWCKAS